MSGRWFRLHAELLNDPKVQNLPPVAFKALINLWCIACKNDGRIPEDDLPYLLRMRPARVLEVLDLLFGLTLLEREDNALVPHSWRERQYLSDTSTTRTRAYRERERHKNVAVTPPDTDTDTEQIIPPKAPKGATALACPLFEEFWKAFPRKIGKGDARKAWRHALRTARPEDIIAGAKRYAAGKPDPQYTKHPGPWLRAERWLDEHAKPNGHDPGGPKRTWAEIKAEREKPPPRHSEEEKQINLEKLIPIRFRGRAGNG